MYTLYIHCICVILSTAFSVPHTHLWCKLAAGDPKVMGVLLHVELVHAQVPDTEVSIRGACSKQLTAGAEGTCDYHGVRNGAGPERQNRCPERAKEHGNKTTNATYSKAFSLADVTFSVLHHITSYDTGNIPWCTSFI